MNRSLAELRLDIPGSMARSSSSLSDRLLLEPGHRSPIVPATSRFLAADDPRRPAIAQRKFDSIGCGVDR